MVTSYAVVSLSCGFDGSAVAQQPASACLTELAILATAGYGHQLFSQTIVVITEDDRDIQSVRARHTVVTCCARHSFHAYYLLSQSRQYEESGLLINEEDRLRLSRDGLYVSDMVITDLLKV